MGNGTSFNIADKRIVYDGFCEAIDLAKDKIASFNGRHKEVMDFYKLELVKGTVFVINNKGNGKSNLGAFRGKQLRQSVNLACSLPAIAVAIHGFGAIKKIDKDSQTKELINQYKRQNDRTSAQVMSEVLQLTCDSFDAGEEVIIESAITEGVRPKPGYEAGGNPTIPVGALYGKEEHCAQYGRGVNKEVSQLSMGSDVIDGTTKSVKGLHSSLTAIFITESHFKRHLPDIYVERWVSGKHFEEFNPRDTDYRQQAEILVGSANVKDFSELTAFFLDRPRHYPPMDQLNALGVHTPFDHDGDLFPSIVMGLEGLHFPNGLGFHSMIGEIGGSAEWVLGSLPVVWRGGQSLGMLTSQDALSKKNKSPQELWKNRTHYTEQELLLLQDARFEQKPYFTVEDLMENPFAGGYSGFCAISDNYYLPLLEGVSIDVENGLVTTNSLIINSLGIIKVWRLTFKFREGLKETAQRMQSPKVDMMRIERSQFETKIKKMAQDPIMRFKFKQFFINEYYPAIIHTNGRMIVLDSTIDQMIERDVLNADDRLIIDGIQKAIPEWFTH